MAAKRKLSVFLSYAPGDVSAAQTLHERLTAEGWMDVWFKDEDLLIGQGKNYEIGSIIQNTDIAIICISKKATTEAGTFHKELRLIMDKAEEMPEGVIFIIPLRLEECEPPFVLRGLQFANYFENNREKIFPNILRSLEKRASQLNINATSARQKSILAEDSRTTSDKSSGIDVKGSVSNSAIVSGDHNIINIYNDHKPDDNVKK